MKTILAEMAGTVLEVKVKVGDSVRAGQEVMVLESMKMEVPVVSNDPGTVKRVAKAQGEFVKDGDILVEFL